MKQLGGAFLRVFASSLAITLGVGLGLFALWEIGDLPWDWREGPCRPADPSEASQGGERGSSLPVEDLDNIGGVFPHPDHPR